MSVRFRLFVIMASLGLAPLAAQAQGNLLHGIGPVNGAMGGAGTALLEDPLGALTFNPALIVGAQGNQLSFSSEFFKDSPRVDTLISFAQGSQALATNSGTREFVINPAFGWMAHAPDKKFAIGFGLIAIGGFRTDYAQNTASVLFAQQPSGLGRVFSDYHLTKIPVAMAYQLTPKLAVGVSVNVYYAEWAQSPMLQTFDVGVGGARFYPPAGNMDGRFAIGGQFGFVYQASPKMAIGGSITTPQDFGNFTWDSTIVDPGSVAYGQARTVTAQLNGPLIVSLGTGIQVDAKTRLAIDGVFTNFKGASGLGSPGGIVNGDFNPFGWRNTWTVKAGVEHQLTAKVSLRLGYNFSQTPLRSDVILTAGVFSPVTFEHHFCGGFGYKLFPFLSAEGSFYYVPRSTVSGPYTTIQGFTLGNLDVSNQATSGVVGMRFTF